MTTPIEKLTDEQVNQLAAVLIMSKGDDVKNFCTSKKHALRLVGKLKAKAIDERNPLELNFDAFAQHIYDKTLPTQCTVGYARLDSPQVFLLFLAGPRVLTEACLLAVNFDRSDYYKTYMGEN